MSNHAVTFQIEDDAGSSLTGHLMPPEIVNEITEVLRKHGWPEGFDWSTWADRDDQPEPIEVVTFDGKVHVFDGTLSGEVVTYDGFWPPIVCDVVKASEPAIPSWECFVDQGKVCVRGAEDGHDPDMAPTEAVVRRWWTCPKLDGGQA